MQFLMIISLLTGVELFFLENTSDLLVKVSPSNETKSVSVCYSFHTVHWDTTAALFQDDAFKAVINPPDSVQVMGCYCIYDEGAIDDNGGQLYLYQVSRSPKFIVPFSLSDLRAMMQGAKKKIQNKTYVDEAIMVLDHVRSMLNVLPYVSDSSQEIERGSLLSELHMIQELLGP